MTNLQDLLNKVYYPVPWYENYEASRDGTIRKKDYYIKNRHGWLSLHKWYVCKYTICQDRATVSITSNGVRKMKSVARIIALTFLWLDEDKKSTHHGTCVCHKDDNPLNNNVDNLFLGTPKDNAQDMSMKERWGSRVLNKEQVVEIRSKYVYRKYPMHKLATEYWVNRFTIYAIIKWMSWKWLK